MMKRVTFGVPVAEIEELMLHALLGKPLAPKDARRIKDKVFPGVEELLAQQRNPFMGGLLDAPVEEKKEKKKKRKKKEPESKAVVLVSDDKKKKKRKKKHKE